MNLKDIHELLDKEFKPEQVSLVIVKILQKDLEFSEMTWTCLDDPMEPAEDFYNFHVSFEVMSTFYATLSKINTIECAMLRALRVAEEKDAARVIAEGLAQELEVDNEADLSGL